MAEQARSGPTGSRTRRYRHVLARSRRMLLVRTLGRYAL